MKNQTKTYQEHHYKGDIVTYRNHRLDIISQHRRILHPESWIATTRPSRTAFAIFLPLRIPTIPNSP
ncbi:MAG: hypothetical protein KKH91_04335, partial [Elusimicrobia bacterium]|nr:hypothetical protein [Elusimicrobiota bacterium]